MFSFQPQLPFHFAGTVPVLNLLKLQAYKADVASLPPAYELREGNVFSAFVHRAGKGVISSYWSCLGAGWCSPVTGPAQRDTPRHTHTDRIHRG